MGRLYLGIGFWAIFTIVHVGHSEAACRYFRSSLKVTACREVPRPSVLHSTATSELSLEDPAEGAMRNVRCACGYTFEGSDPRCDFDRLEEPSATVSIEETGVRCEKALQVCASLCEKRVQW